MDTTGHGARTSRRPWMSRVAPAALAIAGVAAVLWMADLWYWQEQVGGPVRDDLGIVLDTPVLMIDGWPREVLSVSDVRPGSPMATAGVEPGDIIIGDSPRSLARRLNAGRGGFVELRLVPGGDGPPLESRPLRVVRVEVPSAPSH